MRGGPLGVMHGLHVATRTSGQAGIARPRIALSATTDTREALIVARIGGGALTIGKTNTARSGRVTDLQTDSEPPQSVRPKRPAAKRGGAAGRVSGMVPTRRQRYRGSLRNRGIRNVSASGRSAGRVQAESGSWGLQLQCLGDASTVADVALFERMQGRSAQPLSIQEEGALSGASERLKGVRVAWYRGLGGTHLTGDPPCGEAPWCRGSRLRLSKEAAGFSGVDEAFPICANFHIAHTHH